MKSLEQKIRKQKKRFVSVDYFFNAKYQSTLLAISGCCLLLWAQLFTYK